METNIRFIRSVRKASPLPIAAIDISEVKLIYSSGLAEKLLGYTSNELVEHSKTNFQSIIHPDDHLLVQNSFNQIISSKEGDIIKVTFRIRKSNGTYLHWLARDIVFDRDSLGHPLKYTTIIQDITDIVLLEKEIGEKVEALNQISYKNSHELRGPVASILGLINLMKLENFYTEHNQKLFKHLEKAVVKLDSVIKEILQISNT